MSGTQDLVIAAGVESMSMVPMGTTVALPMKEGLASPFGQGWRDRYGDQEISQFRGAQLMCEKWGIKRAELEEYSLESHARAIRATLVTTTGGVGAVAQLTSTVPERLTSVNASLKPVRDFCETV